MKYYRSPFWKILAACAVASLSLVYAKAGMTQGATSLSEKPMRVVIPYAPGGATDVVARRLGEKINAVTGQPVVVDNRPGGASVIAVRNMLASPADGHTIALFDSASSTLTPFLFKEASYDPKDLVPITMVAHIPFAIMTSPDFPASNLSEFVSYVKANPGLPFASSGMGNSVHISMERFLSLAELKMTHVPYKGAAPALQDLAAGQVTVAMMDISSANELLKAGKLKAIAVTSSERSTLLPDTPTISESGYSNFQAGNWFAYFVRRGTPEPMLDELNAVLRKIIDAPDMENWLKSIALEPYTTSVEEAAQFVKADAQTNQETIKKLGLTLN